MSKWHSDGTTIDYSNEIASHKQQTIKTHNAVSIALSGASVSSWFDAIGFDKIAVTFRNDAVANSSAYIHWSNDGVTQDGEETIIPTGASAQKQGILDTKSRYFRVYILNNDATLAHVMSAWAFLKA